MSSSERTEIRLDPNPTGQLDAAVPGALVPLRSLPQEHLASDDPDVRGWAVLGDDGNRIGDVDDLLVDAEARKVRFLIVSLDPAWARGESTAGESAEDGPIPGVDPDAPGTLERGMVVAVAGVSGVEGLSGITGMLAEEFVRSTITDEELALARDGVPADPHRVLVPIGAAAIDSDQRQIVVRGLLASHAAGLPDYHGQLLTHEAEAGLRQRFGHA
jgi:hypothetical protein